MNMTHALYLVPLSIILIGGACGGGRVHSPDEATVAPEAPAPAGPDAFGDWAGERVDAGASFVLDGVGRGVRGVGVVVVLDKVKTSSWTKPTGEEQTEGTAHITIRKGEESAVVRIPEGETGQALGVHIAVSDADVAYDERTSRWAPQATVVVTAAP